MVTDRLKTTPDAACEPAGKPPHIIMVHDESAFDIRNAPNIRVPPGYGRHFRSFDGKQRDLIVEAAGGPSWYTEYNVFAGLSARSFGKFSYFVTRIAAGRVERGLPQFVAPLRLSHLLALSRARRIHGHADLPGLDRRAEFLRHECDALARGRAGQLLLRHRHQDVRARALQRPDVLLHLSLGQPFPVGLPLAPRADAEAGVTWATVRWSTNICGGRRWACGSISSSWSACGAQFPGERFMIVRYGDHQPDFATQILEPSAKDEAIVQRLMANDPRYYTTYYAIDAINYRPVNISSAHDSIEAPYLPLVVLESAGVPLDPSFAEQKKIFERCRGLFYSCADGAEARRFNRLLIDAGLIKGL